MIYDVGEGVPSSQWTPADSRKNSSGNPRTVFVVRRPMQAFVVFIRSGNLSLQKGILDRRPLHTKRNLLQYNQTKAKERLQKGREKKTKLTMSRISQGEDEVIIRYRQMNGQIEAIAGMVQGFGQKLCAFYEGQTFLLTPEDILYLESVDGVVYAYLADRVLQVKISLWTAAAGFEGRGFLSCSKARVINLYKISHLKSEPGNRICATMENGEQVMISRKYAKDLRQRLKGGAEEDEE